ncbi:MAG: hypothetical protein KTR32_41805 [Granulosicoccus sp.]|nr:hypothetical protein [Granulosicoccus sp.]
MSGSDLLWLLLPVAATAGWYAGRRGLSKAESTYAEYSKRFHRELNQLFSASDENIDYLDQLTDSDNDAAQTQIALGNLFRYQGQIDRAIAIHENLANKDSLEPTVRAKAQLELANDYDSAGLLDRSESALLALIASSELQSEACSALLRLHERQQDWATAIDVARQWQQLSGQSKSKQISHYYCELALHEHSIGRDSAAQQLANDALTHWPDNARAIIFLATMALESGEYAKAIDFYDKVENMRPELMPVIIDQHYQALQKVGDPSQLELFIQRIQSQRNAYSVIRKTRDVLASLRGASVADRFFKDQILKRPSLKGLRDWGHDQLELSKPGEQEKVRVICELLDALAEDKPLYRCQSCGFEGNVMHWRCPGCGSWDTVSTIIGVEGE